MQQQQSRANSMPTHQTQPVKRLSLIQNGNQEMQLNKNTLPLTNENEYKYLPPIKPVHQEFNDTKWQEYKIDGKNIHNRAYTSLTYHDNYLYLFGGYQVSLGVMSDFYRMQLTNASFQWERIQTTTKETPGGRTRHSFCTHPASSKLFLFGGQTQASLSTNLMFYYDVDAQKWVRRKLNKTYPPELDNQSSCVYSKGEEHQWIIVGGFFGGQIGLHSNCVFSYNFESNEWQKFYPQNISEGIQGGTVHAPTPRDGGGLARFGERVFYFGGSNGHERFNDIWSFHLEKKEWSYVQVKNQIIPRVRSGHSFNIYGSKLILFGGIHDITWELDDLFCFDIETSTWSIIDDDSSRRKESLVQSPQKDLSPNKIIFRNKQNRGSSLKKKINIKSRGKSSVYNSRENSPNKTNNDQSQSDLALDQNNKLNLTLAQVHQKTLDEKKKKESAVKKLNMLKMFEVNDGEKIKFDNHSPTSEAMKNSLLVIGNPKSDLKVRPGKLTEFGKATFSRFLQPLSATRNSIQGKRPCARDGHCTVVVNNLLIIFGGDRHQMSFNDIHAVDLNQIKPEEFQFSQLNQKTSQDSKQNTET